jgi:hypothetical protein
VCFKCGQQHENKQCTVDKPKCANCKGEHPPSSKTCPQKIEKLLVMKKVLVGCLSFFSLSKYVSLTQFETFCCFNTSFISSSVIFRGTNCQQFGHMQSDCSKPRVCFKCGQQHENKQCTVDKPKCAEGIVTLFTLTLGLCADFS